jgi:hypothetical protein
MRPDARAGGEPTHDFEWPLWYLDSQASRRSSCEVASLLLSRMTVPITYYVMNHRSHAPVAVATEW